ncbi:glycogen synthase (ADP-glucose) [Cognatiyoonia koreensis]|uniref:Glycogen synthase n=1 Tax=Cognatiyoonia koreensis TaxID=364200 RepID=A0A1I0QSK7_9RHOB|nr:glycogen synthase GlgA [Cognatiyoonia koreensis]SEW30300.1 glycogen synthase (ADP-glucose) [Cognatiyoonia koreensis]
MTNTLFVVSECAPLVKTGGLADVAGALPGALAQHGVAVRVLLPGYRTVMRQIGKPKVVARYRNLFGGSAKLLACKVAGIDLLILDAPHLYDRDGAIYGDATGADWPDNAERFAALCKVGAMIAAEGVDGWTPDIVHGHDWQAGLTPEYMHALGVTTPFVFTIHNIAFHGNTDAGALHALGLDPARFTSENFEFWGQISALKAGLVGAAKINTVSQTYAEELLTPEFGIGMDGILRARQADLSGIVNGIDLDTWNPATDPNITPYKSPTGKAANKRALRKTFGLGPADGPLCVLVSRLTEQKGIDLLLDALPALLEHGGQLALLGSGDPKLEIALLEAADRHENLSVKIGYDEALSHRMMAGGDVILVPSRFEPCGLTQLYGLRYGTLPLVALTGGLADTVINASPAALARGVATGIQFFPITAQSLANAFVRLMDLFNDSKTWKAMQRNAMKQPVGWETSAAAYNDIYTNLIAARG